ncbi:unnamed protein product, partial [Prorocentrum cordatum]
EKGKGHNLGPPAATVFVYLLKALMELEVGAQNRKGLEQLLQRIEHFEPWDLVQMCHVCRLEKCYDEGKIKIVLATPVAEVRKLLRQCMEQIGATTTVGQAPAGYLEEELGAYVDMIGSS